MNYEEDFRLLFIGYVQLHLEYFVHVWSPYLKKDIECLEKGPENNPYSERFAVLHV